MAFLEYCRTHQGLLKPQRKFIPYLGGGMAVKLYLKARGLPIPALVANTKDFDFTFAVNRHLNATEVTDRAIDMGKMMLAFLKGFVDPKKLTIESYKAKGVGYLPGLIPATGKVAYHVVQFKKDGKDFVDCTLAFVPGITRTHLHYPFSRLYGLPIERLKFMHRGVLVVLAGSFVYAGIKKRNPLGNENPEKGLKNVARIKALGGLKSPLTAKFVKAINVRSKSAATVLAKRILNKMQKGRFPRPKET